MNTYDQNTTAGGLPANQPDNGCLDWDDEIEKDGQDFILLPEGDYVFEVIGCERGRFPGGPKIPPCNKAMLTLQVTTPEGIARIYADIIMHRTVEWKISSFFRCIGQKEKGETISMRWDAIVGSRGRAHIKTKTYTAGDGSEREKNEVVRYLDYDPQIMSQIEAQCNGFDLKRTSSGGSELPAWVTEARRSGACEDDEQGELPF